MSNLVHLRRQMYRVLWLYNFKRTPGETSVLVRIAIILRPFPLSLVQPYGALVLRLLYGSHSY
jgi:hypothetical protein